MKTVLIILGILFFVGLGLWAWQSSAKSPTAKINNRTFKLFVAKTDKDKQVGLSKYKSIKEEQGMIFSFGKDDYYRFWMKEMKFPIDLIYINDGKIVTIYKNVPIPKDKSNPQIYNSNKPADTVLEISAGLSQKYNFKEGDSVALSNI